MESRERKTLQDRGAPLREEGDTIREYKAMHDENILSSGHGSQKSRRKKRIQVREKGEDETVVKRKCVNPVSVEAFDIFSQGEISECVVLTLTVNRGRDRLHL